ncbi:glycosyltransferase family 2 protein [Flavicella sp.]|uniref:glycosyltransferase family 2 protein n=1 Tax=Flavicella sp. TaxID=2957742 RepID=UPI00301A4A4C
MSNRSTNSPFIFQVSIVTVGMNHLSYLKVLLKSIFLDHPPTVSFEFIYVDNCSIDGSLEFVKRNYEKVVLIENKKIKGFGENNNIGVLKSSGKYVAIINPDITILRGSIDKLFGFLELNGEVGIVAPQLLNPDLSIQYSVRRFMSLKILFWRLVTKGKDTSNNKIIKAYLLNGIDVSKTQPVDWAIGASLFMTKSFYNELSGFDEDYFLYVEDEDLCYRSWVKNKSVIYFPEAKMIHNHLRLSSKLNKTTYLHFKSMILFLFKNGFFIKNEQKT